MLLPTWLSGRALASHARGQWFESTSRHDFRVNKKDCSESSLFCVCLSASSFNDKVYPSAKCTKWYNLFPTIHNSIVGLKGFILPMTFTKLAIVPKAFEYFQTWRG